MHTSKSGPDTGQKYTIKLHEIVPEYHSKNFFVRWLFIKRLTLALCYLKDINPAALIDIGCGDGYLIRLLNTNKIGIKEMWGIDLNPQVIQLNSEVQNCTFSQQSIFRTDFSDQKFDIAVGLDVLEHLKDIETALCEIRRILTPHGYLITSEPVESVLYKSLRFLLKGTYSQESGPGAGKHYFNARQIDQIITHSGFQKRDSKKIPLPRPFDLFHINLYQKI